VLEVRDNLATVIAGDGAELRTLRFTGTMCSWLSASGSS
jgi:hypothetical protein